MKRILIISLGILLCISSAGCVKDKTGSSAVGSTSISVSSNSSVASSSGISGNVASTAKSSAASSADSTKDLVNQLDDLEKVLSDLDQITASDVEIPTP